MRTAVVVLLLAGCVAFEPGAERIIEADRIVAETLSAARAPAGEQKAALARAQQAHAAQPSAASRVRLGALFATLPAPQRDDARALELLEPVADANAPGHGRLAALLVNQVGERQRAARERALTEVERDRREEAMRQQLETLRTIERSILQREEKLRRRER